MAKKTKRDNRGFTPKNEAPESQPTAPIPQTSSWRLFLVNLDLFKRFGAPIVVIVIIPSLLTQVGTVLTGPITMSSILAMSPRLIAGVTISSIAGVWSFIGLAGAYYYALRLLGGRPSGILETYRRSLRFLPRLILLSFILVIIVVTGLALLIVPGLIWFRRYSLAPYFMIDADLGVRDALVASSEASRPKPVRRAIWSMWLIILGVILTSYVAIKYIPMVGPAIGVIISALYVFLPPLRYQEITSDIRAGRLAFQAEADMRR